VATQPVVRYQSACLSYWRAAMADGGALIRHTPANEWLNMVDSGGVFALMALAVTWTRPYSRLSDCDPNRRWQPRRVSKLPKG
jgi:hypothetical protein